MTDDQDVRSWLKQRLVPLFHHLRLPLLMLAAAAALVIAANAAYAWLGLAGGSVGDMAAPALLAMLVLFFGALVAVFTRQLDENDYGSLRSALVSMVQLSYLFGFFFLLVVLLPFLMTVPALFAQGEADPQVRHSSRVSDVPFFVTKACTLSTAASRTSELDCGQGLAQWVFNFGGVVDALPAPGAGQTVPAADSLESHTVMSAGVEPPGGVPESGAMEPARLARPVVAQVNLQPDLVSLKGGLVVPVYFVFIAVAGAVVGMLRRVPEIQRKCFEWINAREAGAAIPAQATPISLAREYLMFQIVQVVTAPFIALLAYAIIEPESGVATTVIAFASGFSSEPFLLIVRDISNRLTGTSDK